MFFKEVKIGKETPSVILVQLITNEIERLNKINKSNSTMYSDILENKIIILDKILKSIIENESLKEMEEQVKISIEEHNEEYKGWFQKE